MKRLSFVLLSFLAFSLHSTQAASPVVITEFMASNTRSLTNAGQTMDWIEIRNVSPNVVNLLNWSLTDVSNNPAKWRFPATNINPGAFMVIFASEPARAVPGAPLQTGFQLAASGEYLALVEPDGTIATQFAPSYPPQISDVAFGSATLFPTITAVPTNAPARVRVPSSGADGANWLLAGFDDSAWTVATNGVGYSATANTAVRTQTRTDVGVAMSNINASAYIRLPFTVADTASVAQVTLRMRYDDGFIAYLNGVEVARANAPETPAFDSPATNAHAPTLVEEFRFLPLALQQGNNMLAIQGLNQSAADTDFLIGSELILEQAAVDSPVPLYLTRPTPGAANSVGSTNIGPTIFEVSHTPNVPLDNEDIFVTARFSAAFFPVSNIVMRYRVMFGAEVEQPMLDDGLHGDGAAGDGLFGAIIPNTVSTNSEMVRWFIRATDIRGNTSRFPLFPSSVDSAEYLGTIVNDGYVTSKLPIFHIYAPTTVLGPGPTTTQSGADSQQGGRVSIFHKGEFYDNVSMQLRGNSTSGFNKKSHRVEFNREHMLKHDAPGGRIRATSFVADYPDPTYMRQGMSYWLCEITGLPSPFYAPVRLQLNGRFYQLANHNDLHGEEFLSRVGLDPNGALYNAAGQITPGRASTGGFEKKTRKWEVIAGDANADYTALANAIAESLNINVRGSNFIENFDVPNAISYAVAARWVHENDDVWANMSIYHDNDGDNQWKIIPFDMNLSWGAIFYEGGVPAVIEGVQATNDTHKAHPMYGSSVTPALNSGNFNRIYDVIFQHPKLREMFLRRLRTVMDTIIQSPDTPEGELLFESRVRGIQALIEEEAERDRNWWAWPAKGGQANFDPGIRINPGVDAMINDFIVKRRQHFFVKHSILNASASFPVGIMKTNNAGIPQSQFSTVSLGLFAVEYNPATGNQDHEYICLTNASSDAIDISGWKLSSAVDFTFRPGTVVPSFSSVYVTPNVRAFRTRPGNPRGVLAVGPYSGQLSARGESIVLTDLTGRVVLTNAYTGNPSLAQQHLRVSEIMYNPAGNTNEAQEFEYIEIQNISATETVSLAGVRFIEGVIFDFGTSAQGSLAPGATALVVRNPAKYAERYGALAFTNVFSGTLDNGGERIRLVDASNEEILDFRFNNTWYPSTDGQGFSLVIVDPNAEPDLWGNRAQWRPSGQLNGSPGANDPAPPVFAPVVVNEVLSSSLLPQVDAIELHNPSTNVADIGGWYITDDVATPKKFRIPNGTTIPAGGFISFDETQFNPGGAGFGFSSDNDEAWIYSGDAAGELTGYAQGVGFGAGEVGVSFGRYTNSVGTVHFVAQSAQTFGAVNAGPKVGPVVISEIMYHPLDIGTNDNSADEFIELRNITGADVNLFDPAAPTNTWKLTELVDFTFPPNRTLAAGKAAIVANIDVSIPANEAAFRAKYALAADVQLFGPYSGKLDNSGGRIELKKPGVPRTNGVPYIIADQVEYSDQSPWPVTADGGGASLQRVVESAYGNDPANWIAVGPSGGISYVPGGTPPGITTQPASTFGVAGRSVTLSVAVDGTAPFFYQWRFNSVNLSGANTATLTLDNLRTRQAGFYDVVILNSAGSIQSASAQLTVLLPPLITQNPVSRSVYIKPDSRAANLPNGTNVTFTVVASSGNPGLGYQWRFNGVDIPGATSPSYTVMDVGLDDEGDYLCVVSDIVDTVVSAPARLVPWLQAAIVQRPTDSVVPVGGSFSVSATAAGNPPNFTYSWRRSLGSLVLNTNTGVNNLSDFRTFTAQAPQFTYVNGTLARVISTNFVTNQISGIISTNFSTNFLRGTNFQCRLVVINDANTNGATLTFNVFVMADTDQDGVPDDIEDGLGLNPNDSADGAGDLDQDGISNRDEFAAGTDPNNAASALRVEPGLLTGLATVSFRATANRTYTVQYTDNLNSGSWTRLGDVPARGTNFVQQFIDPTWTTNRFYRAVTPRQP